MISLIFQLKRLCLWKFKKLIFFLFVVGVMSSLLQGWILLVENESFLLSRHNEKFQRSARWGVCLKSKIYTIRGVITEGKYNHPSTEKWFHLNLQTITFEIKLKIILTFSSRILRRESKKSLPHKEYSPSLALKTCTMS